MKKKLYLTNDKKLVVLIVLAIFCFYYFLDYILKTDMLSFITFRRNGITISFVGVFLFIITPILIGLIITVVSKRKN